MLPKNNRSKKLTITYRDEYILRELENGRDYNEICEYFNNNCEEGIWDKLNKLIKKNGAIVLFGSEPFSSALRMSNIKHYKYDWVWLKNRSANFVQANYQPLKKHEIISIFSLSPCSYTKKGIKSNYHPIMSGKARINKGQNSETCGSVISTKYTTSYRIKSTNKTGKMFPVSVLKFDADTNKHHPTQKPVALMEYLIKTYTNKGETVLDFTMGSGTTMLACQNLERNGIGIELDNKYFAIAQERLSKVDENQSWLELEGR